MDKARIMNFFNSEETLLITGSLNCNADDRYLNREDIHPVQVLIDGELKPISFFDSWGEYGASSFTWLNNNQEFLFSTGDNSYLFNVKQGTWQSLGWLETKDVHEVELIKNTLWLANTGYNEALGIKANNAKVKKRLKLKMLQNNNQIENISYTDTDFQTKDSFHCNQITQDYNGQLIALVHHTSGQQIIRKVANKLIKNQGNGGIINLDTGESINLKLKSPHSIRQVEGNYWIFDSGNARIHIYNQNWQLLNKIDCAGFGRGAGLTQSGVFCAGISETRKRYLNVIKGAKKVPNMIQFFASRSHKFLTELVIRDIEQVNNVYVINKEKIKPLLTLDKNYSESIAAADFINSPVRMN